MEYFYLEDEKSMSICKMVSRDTTHSEGILHHTAYVWVIKDEFKKNNAAKKQNAKPKNPGMNK